MRRATRLFFSSLGMLMQGTAFAQSPLILQYSERPPFMTREPDGSVGGTVATRAARAFQKAGIPIAWQIVSSKRQLAILQANAAPTCSVGWYKTTEREFFFKFTKAISQDSPMIALANSGFKATGDGKVADLLSNPDLNVLVKDSVFYGAFLESQFASMKAKRVMSSDEYGPLIRLVHLGRVQVTFIPVEEANYYIEKMGYTREDFNIIHFSDMPPGEKRYVICSRKVDDAIIDKVNAQLNITH